MYLDNKTKARKLFWYSLLLFITAQMFQVFAKPSNDFVADITASLASGLFHFPFGILFPLSRAVDITIYDKGSGNALMDGGSLLFSFLAAFCLFYGARRYAQGKGYHGAVGYLGLLGFAGIVILLMLPDNRRTAFREPQWISPFPDIPSVSSMERTDRMADGFLNVRQDSHARRQRDEVIRDKKE